MRPSARKPRSGTKGKTSRSATRASPRPAAPQILQSPVPTDRWTAAILIFLIAGTPLAILPARFETYDTTPKLCILYLSSALFLWCTGRWWPGIAALWRTSIGRAFYSLLILGVASLFISSAFSNDAWLSFAGTVWRRLGGITQAIIFFIAAVIAGIVSLDRASAKTLMLGMENAGAITSIYAILQYAGWDPLIPAHLYKLGSPAVVRPPATLVQATFFATFLLPAIFIALGLRLHERTARWKRFHELVFFLTTAALVLSGTRSALLGLTVGACALIYSERTRLANWRTLARGRYPALAITALFTALLLLPTGKGVRIRLGQWVTDRAGGPRLLVWRDSLPLFGRHPLAGIGPELFEAEFRRTESLELARAFPDHYHESPHNFFLEVAVGQGILGLGVWMALLGLACYCGVLSHRRKDVNAVPLTAALLAMLVSLQFCPLTVMNELYMIALIAVLAALAGRHIANGSYRRKLSPILLACSRSVSVALVLIAAAYVSQAALYTLVESRALRGDIAEADHWYRAAHRFPMPGPNLAVSQRIASLAPRFSPPKRLEALAFAKEAAETAERSEAERFNALYQSAVLAIMSRDLTRAETKLRAAVAAAPAWYRPRMALACVLWWQRRGREAQREAALALDYAGRNASSVKRTLDGARAQANVIPVHP